MTALTGGLLHLGLLHHGSAHLVALALPLVRNALAEGGQVRLVVDRRTVRAFQDALGPDADRVGFPSPAAFVRPRAPGFARTVREWTRRGTRALLLGPVTTDTAGGSCEDALNLVHGDLPLTVVCTCGRDAPGDLVTILERDHPELLTDAGAAANPAYRPPRATSPVPRGVWGNVALRLAFAGTGDLARLRGRVTRVVEDAGLRGEAVDAAVLAVHEAAVLACRDARDGEAELRLELRRGAGTLLAEVVGPVAEPADERDPLDHLRPFCAGATVHEDAGVRTVRVLATL